MEVPRPGALCGWPIQWYILAGSPRLAAPPTGCVQSRERIRTVATFEGKVALVTGAGSGIGRATALHLAAGGAKIVALGKTLKHLEETAAAIAAAGGEATTAVADISVAEMTRDAIDAAASHWGRIDIVIANAGFNGVWAALEDIEPHEWERTLAVNLTGTFFTVKYAVPYLKRQGGAVVVVSSVNGTRIFSNTGATAYSCSKAGQVAFAKMTALELAPHKIRVNVICPGAIETNINTTTVARDLVEIRTPIEFPKGWHPLRGAPGQAEQVAKLAGFLVSDDADHITGTEMWIDGWESLLRG
jgi:NAD(P)-dependent dehydrogenase (short-subunit alcohol dehydrogenase family)